MSNGESKPMFRDEGTLEQLTPENFEHGKAEPPIPESRLAEGEYKTPENHIFRKGYRNPDPSEAKLMGAIKDKAFELHTLMSTGPKTRETALALTNLEQSVMWCIKAITG